MSAPDIFLSYSRKDEAFVNPIDNDFTAIGIRLKRDVRDIPYQSDINEFMKRVGTSDFVMMIISDNFLKSKYCMFEVTEFLQSPDFEKRILPVILEDVSGENSTENLNAKFRDGIIRAKYEQYWKELHDQLKLELEKLGDVKSDSIKAELHLYEEIIRHLDDFFSAISSHAYKTLKDLQQEHYRSLLEFVGFENRSLLTEGLRIQQIADREEQDLALDAFLKEYPQNGFGLFLRAANADNRGELRKAKKYYEELLESIPDSPSGHVNYGLLLEQKFNQRDEALKHFVKAVDYDPNFFAASYHAARLLYLLHRIEEALPYRIHLVDIPAVNAWEEMEQAIVYTDFLNMPDKAQPIFLDVIHQDPGNARANYGLGKIFNSTDPLKAEKYYQKAIESDPTLTEALQSYAILIESKDSKKARSLYDQALEADPVNGEIHFNYTILLKNFFKEEVAVAKEHYVKAIAVDPRFRRIPLDELYGIKN
jgi:tetratricopeptide (TPR) repeat protein